MLLLKASGRPVGNDMIYHREHRDTEQKAQEAEDLAEEDDGEQDPETIEAGAVSDDLRTDDIALDLLQDQDHDGELQRCHRIEGCRHYMPVGDLRIALGSFAEGHSAPEAAAVSEKPNDEYLYRTLDLRRAVGTFSYRKGGVGFTQTLFCSAPADVLVVHCEATEGEPIDGVIFMEDGDRRDYIDDNRPYTGDTKNNEATILYFHVVFGWRSAEGTVLFR